MVVEFEISDEAITGAHDRSRFRKVRQWLQNQQIQQVIIWRYLWNSPTFVGGRLV